MGRIARVRIIAVGLLALLSACDSRSISDSGYREGGRYGGGNPLYRGELSAYDVLGIDPAQPISEDDIRGALVAKRPISIKKGSAIMLVQSGAPFADTEMTGALERYYTVSTFSGVPLTSQAYTGQIVTSKSPAYAQLFRMAAAKGGFETVIVYWGILESASESLGTKAISWVPIVGGIVPDEAQRMRIRLMMAIIDVRTGQWESFEPPSINDEAISNEHHRAASDQRQVETLKAKAYQEAAEALVARYAR